MEKEKCKCSFCQLRKMDSEQSDERIIYLKTRIENEFKRFRERRIELIELCIKHKKLID